MYKGAVLSSFFTSYICYIGSAFQVPVSHLKNKKLQVAGNSWGLQVARMNTTTDDVTIVSSKEESSKDDNFNWFKAWHPIIPVEFLDIEKVHSFQLLGMDIVVWNDGPIDSSPAFGPKKERVKGAKKSKGKWNVFVDQCPHRKAPLSEGRIEDDGSLLCSYHGWRFNGEGENIEIPQVTNMDQINRIRANPSSKCNSFPVKVVNGLLWVWPDSSDDSMIESALTEVPTLSIINDDAKKERIWTGTWCFRELPYGHDFFIENIVDPAHVPVAHHNLFGNRYNDLTLEVTSSAPLTKAGFSIEIKKPRSEKPGQKDLTSFTAPSQVTIESKIGEKGACQYHELYSSPSRPGFCNYMGRIVILKDETNTMPPTLKPSTLPIPEWLYHVASSAFLNQDAFFLHAQERSLAKYGIYKTHVPGTNDDYSKAILPVSCDKGVMAFRSWMSRFAGGHIPFKGDTTMPATSKDVVFDVWNSHTKHCRYCLTALKNLKRIRFASFFVAALLATVRPEELGVIESTFGAMMLTGVGLVLNEIIGAFYRYEFSHADNH